MKVEILKKEEQNTKEWSGGKTTQLYIFPKDSSYEKRDFIFRISTATVEEERSIFTALPGFSRVLMLLDGSIRIEHKGHHTVSLKPFEKDVFDGSWASRSVGKCRDFNLMMKNGLKGNLSFHQGKYVYRFENKSKKSNFIVIYVTNGILRFSKQQLSEKDSCMICLEKGEQFEIKGDDDSSFVKVEVFV